MTQRRKLWTLEELADFLSIAPGTARRLASIGKVPGCKVGGAWRFAPEAIEAWLDHGRPVGGDVGTAIAQPVTPTQKTGSVDTAAALDKIVRQFKSQPNGV